MVEQKSKRKQIWVFFLKE